MVRSVEELRKEADKLTKQALELYKQADEEEKRKQRIKTIRQRMYRLDKDIWVRFHPDHDDSTFKYDEFTIHLTLKADIVSLLTEFGEEAEHFIKHQIEVTGFADEIYEAIGGWDSVMEEANIRGDFETALKNVKKGWELSSKLQWAFSTKDLLTLLELHKKNKYRKKIEDLLEDCNFHYECGMLMEKRYDELYEEITKDAA